MALKIKKVFSELHAAIVGAIAENAKVKLSDVLPTLEKLMESARTSDVGAVAHKDANGNLTHLFDSYFKQWFPVKFVEFGIKEGTSTGFNSMSKEGQANYSRQLREFKNAKEALLEDVMAGVIQPAEIQGRLDALEVEREQVIPHSIGLGSDTVEAALEISDEQYQAKIDAYNAANVAVAAEPAGV